MSTLRSGLIRLAHENPSMRPHILPLLAGAKTAALSEDEAVELHDDLREDSTMLDDLLKKARKNPESVSLSGSKIKEITGRVTKVDPKAISSSNLLKDLLSEGAQGLKALSPKSRVSALEDLQDAVDSATSDLEDKYNI